MSLLSTRNIVLLVVVFPFNIVAIVPKEEEIRELLVLVLWHTYSLDRGDICMCRRFACVLTKFSNLGMGIVVDSTEQHVTYF